MNTAGALARARESFERQAWEDAHGQLLAEDRERALEPEDLVRLATAAQMFGADADAVNAWTRAHTEFLKRDDKRRAARCAYWMVLPMLFRGDMAQAGGWIARTTRLLDDVTPECAEHGYLLCATRCARSGREISKLRMRPSSRRAALAIAFATPISSRRRDTARGAPSCDSARPRVALRCWTR